MNVVFDLLCKLYFRQELVLRTFHCFALVGTTVVGEDEATFLYVPLGGNGVSALAAIGKTNELEALVLILPRLSVVLIAFCIASKVFFEIIGWWLPSCSSPDRGNGRNRTGW